MSTPTVRQRETAPSAIVLRGRVRRLVAEHGTQILDAVPLRRTGLAGTAVEDAAACGADLLVYPFEHYAYWAEVIGVELSDGCFDEQLSTTGLVEHEVFLGDTFAWGDAIVQVSAPGPHFTPAASAETGAVLALADLTGRTGFFIRVVRPGTVRPGDDLILVDVDPVGISVAAADLVLTSGPTSAGLTDDRVRIARHLFPAGRLDRWLFEGVGETVLAPTAPG